MAWADFGVIAAAVIFGNGLSLAWFLAAIKCHQMQQNGAKDDELPFWVYIGLIAAPLFFALGGYLLKP